jgi:trypsin
MPLWFILFEAVNLFYLVRASLYHRDKVLRRSLKAEPRIVGGTAADVGEFPSFVWTAGSQLCGGSLIWDDIVLTAAHCAGYFIERGIVYNGVRLNLGAGELVRGVEAELPHPNYNITEQDANDIMLVKTKGSLGLPLQDLNFDPNFPESGTTAVVIGFGRTEATGSISDILLSVEVPIVNFDTCNGVFNRINDDLMLCAGGKNDKDCK